MVGPAESGKTTLVNWICKDIPTTCHVGTGGYEKKIEEIVHAEEYDITFYDLGDAYEAFMGG